MKAVPFLGRNIGDDFSVFSPLFGDSDSTDVGQLFEGVCKSTTEKSSENQSDEEIGMKVLTIRPSFAAC
jgi:hypothetical protein